MGNIEVRKLMCNKLRRLNSDGSHGSHDFNASDFTQATFTKAILTHATFTHATLSWLL